MPRKHQQQFKIGAQIFEYKGVPLLITFDRYGVVQDIRPIPLDKSQHDEQMQIDILRAHMDIHHLVRFKQHNNLE